MPYLVFLGLLVLMLAPASVAWAEGDIMGPPSLPPAPETTAIPEDYPEDFSAPETLATANDRYGAFGEDEAPDTAVPKTPEAVPEPDIEPAP